EIEIWIVQDEEEHLVAIGSADQHYEFTVDLPVPPSLDPGPIEIDPRSKVDDRTLVAITDPVIVSEAPPAEPSPERPVRFGEDPAAQPDTSAPPSGAAGSTGEDSASGVSSTTIIGLVSIVAVGIALGVVISRRRRR